MDDDVLLRLDDAQRAVRAELAETPEAAALSDLQRLIGRAQAARYAQHERSLTELAARVQDYFEALPLFGLLLDICALIERRAAMIEVKDVGDMDLVRVIRPPEPWVNEMPLEPGVEE